MPATGEVLPEEDVHIHEDSSSVQTSDDEVVQEQYTMPVKPSRSRRKSTFESVPDKGYHEEFLRESVEILLKDAVFQGTSRSQKVLEWHNPEELIRLFDFKLNHSALDHEDLLKLVKDTIKYSVKTGHPYFVNQLFSALDPYGLVGQWLTDALNPSVYTYEVSPVFTLMEEFVLQEMRRIVGFEDGRGDGIFCPGGSMANGYAISCARYKFNPNIKVNSDR